MCGIFGAYNRNGLSHLKDRLVNALDCLQHRGPDSFGTWQNLEQTLFLGHRRLAIIDLSPAGHQPMHSESGRFTITFNGEIYNYRELRAELESLGQKLTAAGDTAVMLAAFEQWGIKAAISRFSGMFAFAVWDQKEKTLTLARDRIGEKPLYYGWKDGHFVFSSELSAISKSFATSFEINREALGNLLKFGYIPAPLSIYEGVHKLSAASFLTLSQSDLHSKSYQKPETYWHLEHSIFAATEPERSEQDYLEHLEKLLKHSVSQQMISDVPLGAFLSGGVDSSMIVAIMQSVSTQAVRTFSIGFHRQSHDEAPFAKAVANHLKTDHTELYVSEQDALDVVPKLPEIYSEPFGDSSQIPTYLVSKLTRNSVTVSLSGDGGDEIFGGYQRFLMAQRLWDYMEKVPAPLRKFLGSTANKLPTADLDKIIGLANNFLPRSLRLKNAAFKVQRALNLGAVKSKEDLYLLFISQKIDPTALVKDYYESPSYLNDTSLWPDAKDFYTKLMWMDTKTYLPDDIFAKVDRASMAVALEARAPFLDHNLVEFAFRLPTHLKIKGNTTKYLLKKLLEKYVPRELTERPKMGFGIPVSEWLSGKLRPWAEDLLSESALNESGLLHSKPILEIWRSQLAGNHSNQYFLWHVLMFQAWYRSRT